MPRFREVLVAMVVAALGTVAGPCLADALAFVGMSNGQTVIIDSGTATIVGTIAADTDAIALTPNGRRAFLSNTSDATVRVVDVATKSVIHTISALRAPGINVTSDATRLYAASVNDNTVKVFDANNYAPMATLPVGASPVCIAISPNGQLAYVSNFNAGTLSRVDVSTNSVLPGTVAVGGKPAGLVFHPTQPFAYVSNYASDAVQVIDVAASSVIVTIPVGDGPDSIAVTPAGDRLLVGNTISNTVSVIDVATYTVIATIPTGYPGGLGVLADGRTYALCSTGGVCVIGPGNTITGTIPLPAYAYTYGDFIGPPVSAPDAPGGVTGTPGNSEALISFTPGASDGGLAPSSYTVQVSPGGAEASGTASPILVTGLTNGNAYTFKVRATNLVGPSAYSAASGSVTPSAISDVAIVQSATPDPVGAGKDLVLTMVVTNNGPAAVTGLNVFNDLTGAMSVAWTSPLCTSNLNQVHCVTAGGALAVGASVTFRAVVRPAAAGSIGAMASVVHAGMDPTTGNDSSTVNVTVDAVPVATAVLRYRLYSDVSKEHLFTTDLNEYTVLGASGNWAQEGTVGKVLDNPGSFNGVNVTPYYRLYDTSTRWHHWTTDPNEYYTLIQFPSWNGEGVDGYILPTNTAGATELFRLNYPHIPGLHHWTIDVNEYNTLIGQHGWVGEPGAGFVLQY